MLTNQPLIDRVLLAAELVPAGRVVSYGDIAELVGTSARRVGAIMRDHGSTVPWWRVISASGELSVLEAALPHWRREGIELAPHGRGCRISSYRADLAELLDRYEEAEKEMWGGT